MDIDVNLRASGIVSRIHADETDKAGVPYIMGHIQTVYWSLVDVSPRAAIIGMLHDSLETLIDKYPDADIDTMITINFRGIPDDIIQGVKLITNDKSGTYQNYIDSLKDDKDVVFAKIADLCHNMKLSRLPIPRIKDIERLRKYQKTYAYLIEHCILQGWDDWKKIKGV